MYTFLYIYTSYNGTDNDNNSLYRITVFRVVLHGLLLRGVQAQQWRRRTELGVAVVI